MKIENSMPTVRALVHQVSKASRNRPEYEVTTLITRPMWERWCEELGEPKNSVPTPWTGKLEGNRVYGSRTIIVESQKLWSVSVAIKDWTPSN